MLLVSHSYLYLLRRHRDSETHRASIPFSLHLEYRYFGNLHVRNYTRACACPLYVPSYVSLAALLLHMFYLL